MNTSEAAYVTELLEPDSVSNVQLNVERICEGLRKIRELQNNPENLKINNNANPVNS